MTKNYNNNNFTPRSLESSRGGRARTNIMALAVAFRSFIGERRERELVLSERHKYLCRHQNKQPFLAVSVCTVHSSIERYFSIFFIDFFRFPPVPPVRELYF